MSKSNKLVATFNIILARLRHVFKYIFPDKNTSHDADARTHTHLRVRICV